MCFDGLELSSVYKFQYKEAAPDGNGVYFCKQVITILELMTVDRPRDLDRCPERPEHHFLLYPHDHRHTHMHAHINTHILWATGDVSPPGPQG